MFSFPLLFVYFPPLIVFFFSLPADVWGLVCGDGWSLFEAGVVCRELGFGYAQNALQTDFFGGNRSSLVLSGVRCHGSERSLVDCLHGRYGADAVSCPGHKDNIAAVVCASGNGFCYYCVIASRRQTRERRP